MSCCQGSRLLPGILSLLNIPASVSQIPCYPSDYPIPVTPFFQKITFLDAPPVTALPLCLALSSTTLCRRRLYLPLTSTELLKFHALCAIFADPQSIFLRFPLLKPVEVGPHGHTSFDYPILLRFSFF